MSNGNIGGVVPRVDAREKVTGAARFAADLKFGAMLQAKVLRSPFPHARILRIDTSKAERLPGVKAVVTGKDFPNYVGLYLVDRSFFAGDKVRFAGEPVAAVAAVSEEVAEEAVDLIEVDYEELPGVFDPVEAMKPGAPLIHERLGEYQCAPFLFPVPGTNISNHFKLRKGDVDRGFAKSYRIFENTFRVPQLQHSPIETHSAVAQYSPSGKLTIWSSTQSPQAVRALMSAALGVPLNQIRVIGPYAGGGFGGKAGVVVEPIPVSLAIKVAGRPVTFTCTREEEFRATTVRQGMVARLKTGVSREGKILAQKAEFIWDGGAYTEYGANVTRAAGYSSTGPYEIPDVWTDSYCVYTNHPVGGPFRGFGMGEIHWAIEQQIDIIAGEMGIDPVEMRLRNCLRDGSVSGTGEVLEDIAVDQCLVDAAKAIGWGEASASDRGLNATASGGAAARSSGGLDAAVTGGRKVRGKGLAIMMKAPAMPPNAASASIIKFNEDGTINLMTTAAEIGQGSHTVLAQMAAEELGVPVGWISVSTADTDYTPYEWQTVASRITFSSGGAVLKAARDARKQILEVAAEVLMVEPEDLEIDEGIVFVKHAPHKRVSVKDVVMGVLRPEGGTIGGPVMGRGMFIPRGLTVLDRETGQGKKPVAEWTFGCQAAEVEVDLETGQVDVLRVAASYDIGRVINLQTAEGQTQGGIIQGLGAALFEYLDLQSGRVRNGNFVDYKIPTAVDAPKMSVNFVETPLPEGPYGARGFGEHTMVPTAPAIANAIYNAIGVRIKDLPITAEKVLEAIRAKQGKRVAAEV